MLRPSDAFPLQVVQGLPSLHLLSLARNGLLGKQFDLSRSGLFTSLSQFTACTHLSGNIEITKANQNGCETLSQSL